MRVPLEPASFKPFFGSNFLSDFTLIIRCEPTVVEAGTCSQGSGSEQGLQHQSQHDLAIEGSSTVPATSSCLNPAALPEPHDTTAPCCGQHDASSAMADAAGDGSCCTAQPAAHGAAAPAAPSPSSALVKRDSANSLVPSASCHLLRSIASTAAVTSTSGANTNVNASDGSITLPVHGVVLAAASPYFETLLRDWKGSSNLLHMVVAEEQVSAAQVLLGFMYSSTLPSSLSQHDLLQLLLLADRFDVRRAAAAASRVLGCLSPAALEWSTLTGIWALPDHLFEADEQAPVRVVAWDRLMQLFGDLEDSWATADGRSLWQQLPLRAVAALAASDALAVASENTVFAALASWITHAGGMYGRLLTPHDLRLLAASVRLPSMGPCYLSYVALQHDWFRQAVDVAALARSAAFAAASSEVRKDLVAHTAATTTAALAAAANGSSSNSSCGGGGYIDSSAAAGVRAPGGCVCAVGDGCSAAAGGGGYTGGPWGGLSSCGASGRCSWCQQGCTAEQQAQLLALAQAVQRPRASSCKRSCFFQWHVDLAAIRQLHEEVAAAGSRDSRILRSPAHSFAGYEWALQLEITQTRGATGFDGSKPWALGVFLTCQVRVEVPNKQTESSLAAASAGAGDAAGGAAAAAAAGGCDATAGECQAGQGSSSSSSSSSKALLTAAAAQQQQAPLLMQLVDFGFVSTAATISVREVGGKDKRCEKSWEHAVVRYRASWGWPNYLDVQATGWDESAFERWVIDGQMHLQASVRVLG